jgi:hypothetical protein
LTKLKLLTILTLILAITVPATVASAEDVRELVHAYRVWKLTDVLDLSEDQMPAFYSKLREIDRLEAELLKDQREVVERLSKILEEERIDEEKLREALDEHRSIRLKRLEEVGRLRDEAEMMLNTRQRARYLVFDQEFRSDIRNIIQKARDLERMRRVDERLDMQGGGTGTPGGRSGGAGSRGRR